MTDIAPSSPRHRLKLGAAAVVLLAIGASAGSFVGHAFRPAIAMAPAHVTAIRSLTEGAGIVTVKGRVAQRYGNQFVLDDGTGKALINEGPASGESSLAPAGSIVSVQGQFDGGALRPSFLVDASGKVIAIGHVAPGGHRRGADRRDLQEEREGPDVSPREPPVEPRSEEVRGAAREI